MVVFFTIITSNNLGLLWNVCDMLQVLLKQIGEMIKLQYQIVLERQRLLSCYICIWHTINMDMNIYTCFQISVTLKHNLNIKDIRTFI